MPSRVLRSVAANFLGTYLSRYSDYQGYWLFGFLVPTLTEFRIDLLAPRASDRVELQFAIDLAVQRFREQIEKGRVHFEEVSAAELTLIRDPLSVAVAVNGHPGTGWAVRALVVIETKTGRRFAAERRILVAPHNEAAELRSTRAA